MNILVYFAKYWWYCLITGALMWGLPLNTAGQDPLWAIGQQQVFFPGEMDEEIKIGELPTSFNDDIPDQYEYQGALPLRTQNIQFDDEGKVLFFIMDGKIYNRDGLLIADEGQDMTDRDCEVCFLGGEQVHIIPVPGSCTKYYVIGLYFDDFNRDLQDFDEALIRVGVLDVTLISAMGVYDNACMEVNGGFIDNIDQNQQTPYDLHWSNVPILPENGPLSNGVFREGVIHTFTEVDRVIHGASIRIDPQGRSLLAVRVNQGIVFLQANFDGIWLVDNAPGYVGSRWSFEMNGAPLDSDDSQRGEMALHYAAGTLQVAWSSYDSYSFAPLGGQVVHQTKVGVWNFQVGAGVPFIVASDIQPASSPNANPRSYSLDLYPLSADPPLDITGVPILRPAIAGVEFSPNGRYVYFVKSADFAYPNSGGVESNFGYIDLDWTPDLAPLTYYTYLPIAPEAETRKLVDTQLMRNVGPDGTGQALYMVGREADSYWLGAFLDPDNPSASNYQPELRALPSVGSFTDPASPLTEYRYLNRRHYRSTSLLAQQGFNCCDDMNLAKDRSGDITIECDLSWEPGDNAFWDTEEDIHVATELRIKQGAHVMAENMTFKFGENAVMVIEPGASFQCTNCHFTNACDDKRWLGIEAQGTDGQHQWGSPRPTYQSMLVLRGCVVENAEIGVLAGMRPDLNNGGAYVWCMGATVLETVEGQEEPVEVWKEPVFRNCRQGVMMRRHQNFNTTSGLPMRDRSRFDEVRFTVTPDYQGNYDFLHHVNLWAVDGISFTACTFENTLPDGFFANVGSLGLGHGIYSLDAAYSVRSQCTIPWSSTEIPCPEISTRRSTFTGLDHGIHALQGAVLRSFSVDRAQFTNNIAGVYSEGVVGYKVVNSQFSVGGRNVIMTNPDEFPSWQDHHRGVFSTGSYGMIVDDNMVDLDPLAPVGRRAEGIVIGYSGDHNDVVFRNTVKNMGRGYVGEGICIDESQRTVIGLQFWCNGNENNLVNLRSRIVTDINGDQILPQDQSIRLQQGSHGRVADNKFDRELGGNGYDIYNDGWQYNMLGYYWALPEEPYYPLNISQGVAREGNAPNGQPHVRGFCESRRAPLVDYPYITRRDGLRNLIDEEKLAYANQAYLYNALIDGGNTDMVLSEIMDSWPQDAWDLRSYLLSKSPYLTVEVLKSAMEKQGFPEAMKAEVCIANPDATKTEGFLKWLEFTCAYPLSTGMIESIEASWEQRTYRTALEEDMADHHAAMSQAANLLLEYHNLDEEFSPNAELRGVWQEVRTAGGRYAEALSLMQDGQYQAALDAVNTVVLDNPKLRSRQMLEKQHMVQLITFVSDVVASDGDLAQLSTAQLSTLTALADQAYDRPSRWARNILCFHYGECAPPLTGGEEEAPKALFAPKRVFAAELETLMQIAPNPALSWTACTYRLKSGASMATIVLKDALGRTLQSHSLGSSEGQLVLDTRTLGAGLYTLELREGEKVLQLEKLIVN